MKEIKEEAEILVFSLSIIKCPIIQSSKHDYGADILLILVVYNYILNKIRLVYAYIFK